MKIGLRERILLIALGLMLLTLAVLIATFSVFYSKHQSEVLQSRSKAISRSLATQLDRIIDLGIRLDELQGFEAQCQEILRAYPDLSFATIVSPEGRIIFHSNPEQTGQAFIFPARKSLAGRDEMEIVTDQRQVLAMTPVFASDGNRVATAIVAFPTDVIVKERNRLLATTLALGLVAVSVATLLLHFSLSRYVIRPIMGLVEVIGRIRSGDGYVVKRKLSGEGELDILLRGFNQLIDEVAHHEKALLAARDASDAANRAKMEFLAVMSHEIRTPIHAILGMAELLQSTQLDAKQGRYASRIDDAGKSLLAVVDGILDYSKLEAGRLHIRSVPFTLRESVARCVDMVAELIWAKGLELKLTIAPSVPEQVQGDPGRLGQILSNLIGNAVKFTDAGSIAIEVASGDGWLYFTVCDTGAGIDPVFIGHIFEPFTQADSSSSRRHGGTGLGLAIVRQLCEAMGGKVGVRSAPGQGACFWFSLPAVVENNENRS